MPSNGPRSAVTGSLAWAAAVGSVAWGLLWLFGRDWGTPAAQLLAFTPYAALGAVFGAVFCLVVRRWKPAVPTVVAAAVLVSIVLPRAVAEAGPTRGATLRVLSVNLKVGAADAAAIVDLARRERADIVALQEYTEPAQAALEAAGLAAHLPHASRHPKGQALGSALYSRLPLTDIGVRVHGSGFLQAQGTVSLGGTGVAIESAHPRPPIGAQFDDSWFGDLADQPVPGEGRVRILLGDFNATLDHGPFQRLLGRGYRDAADLTGSGLKPTWPADRWWFPGLVLDHVLVSSGLDVRRYSVHAIRGTDHRAVLAELVLGPGRDGQ